MLEATENEVLVIDVDQLEHQIRQGKQQAAEPSKIDFAGELFLSPNEELLAICTHSLIQIVSMSSLPAITTVPIANTYNCQRFLWVGDGHLLLWNFLGHAYLLTIDPHSIKEASLKELEGVKECTGASIVGNSLLICQKLEVWVYDFGKTTSIAKVDLTYEDHPNIAFEFSFIIEIFRVNVHQG
jgi:hypothetical protein